MKNTYKEVSVGEKVIITHWYFSNKPVFPMFGTIKSISTNKEYYIEMEREFSGSSCWYFHREEFITVGDTVEVVNISYNGNFSVGTVAEVIKISYSGGQYDIKIQVGKIPQIYKVTSVKLINLKQEKMEKFSISGSPALKAAFVEELMETGVEASSGLALAVKTRTVLKDDIGIYNKTLIGYVYTKERKHFNLPEQYAEALAHAKKYYEEIKKEFTISADGYDAKFDKEAHTVTFGCTTVTKAQVNAVIKIAKFCEELGRDSYVSNEGFTVGETTLSLDDLQKIYNEIK